MLRNTSNLMDYGLAQGWVSALAKSWRRLRRERSEEIAYIANTFCDAELLRRRYIEPDCQPTNPADYHEDEPGRAFRSPVRDWLNRFLHGEFIERDGRNVVFVLADAGMGKTSLLVMLKFSQLLQYWPSGVEFLLLKLGADTVGEVRRVSDKRNKVLLLDALDEDERAIGRIQDRLIELLDASAAFRQVIISCRTQYFPDAGGSDFGKFSIGGYVCNQIYLSPFSDEQVDTYVRNVFPRSVRDLLRPPARSRQARARSTIVPMQSLRMRPLLLSYVEDLVDADLGSGSEYHVYRVLIDRWVAREERKLRTQHGELRLSKEQLWRVCQTVADFLNGKRSRTITPEQLEDLAKENSGVGALQVMDIGGRSLLNRKSDGSYRFAHYTIQEFFLAHRIITEPSRLSLSQFVATDQVITFFTS